MLQLFKKISIQTDGQQLIDITSKVNNFIYKECLYNGILNISILHTSASLLIQENADPTVLKDIEFFFNRLVPMNRTYQHSSEGIDDMPAHIKSALTNSNITISIRDRNLVIGTWQAIYLYEHRIKAHLRKLALHFIGDAQNK